MSEGDQSGYLKRSLTQDECITWAWYKEAIPAMSTALLICDGFRFGGCKIYCVFFKKTNTPMASSIPICWSNYERPSRWNAQNNRQMGFCSIRTKFERTSPWFTWSLCVIVGFNWFIALPILLIFLHFPIICYQTWQINTWLGTCTAVMMSYLLLINETS